MRGRTALAILATYLLAASPAWAHRLDEYLQATILSLDGNQAHGAMRLIAGVAVAPAVIAAIDTDRNGAFSDDEQRAYAERVLADLSLSIDGKSVQPRLLSYSFPERSEMLQGLGEIHIDYAASLLIADERDRSHSLIVVNRHWNTGSVYLFNAEVPSDLSLRIFEQKRNTRQTVYELDYQYMGGVGDSGSLGSRVRLLFSRIQFSSLFHLGMHHISDGTDHLLFLLTLLLPAPLFASSHRWRGPAGTSRSLLRVLGIVSAFTVGHSVTLTLAAMGAVHIPSRPVEALIAVSILVSALHALRPLLPGKEAFVAVFLGLIHGLAFASTLDRLGMGRLERLGGILSFNLGIEAMQVLVVAAILPSLLLLSRTRAYSSFRIGGALFAVAASVGWLFERVLNVRTPVDLIVNGFAKHSVALAVTLLVVSLLFRLSLRKEVVGRA